MPLTAPASPRSMRRSSILSQPPGRRSELRLKIATVVLGTTRTTTGALALSGGHYFENIILTGKRITTNLGIIRDPGHTEPWIIAMSAKPGYLTTLGYAARWGIEPMFSDFKSRGFGLQQTHLRYPDRLA